LLLVLIFVGLIIVTRKTNKQDNSRKTFKLFGVVIAALIVAALTSILFFVWAFGAFRDSEPVIRDNFYLHKTGVTREYIITPRFKDWLAGANGDYEITVYLEKAPSTVLEKIEFHPIVKVSTILNDNLLGSVTIDKPLNVIIDERYSKKVLLAKLPKVLWSAKNNSYTVKVEVLQGDETLLQHVDYFNTRIAVDSYP
jgi:hypothetical protein